MFLLLSENKERRTAWGRADGFLGAIPSSWGYAGNAALAQIACLPTSPLSLALRHWLLTMNYSRGTVNYNSRTGARPCLVTAGDSKAHVVLGALGVLIMTQLSLCVLPPSCHDDERPMLRAFFKQMDGRHWQNSAGWSSDDLTLSACGWHGVSCTLDGRVDSVELTGNRLRGQLADAMSSLRSLCLLRYLDLSGNRVFGSIPAEFAALHGLQGLRLDYNRINGSLPAELAALDRLQVLSLSSNELSGTLPSSFGVLSALQELDLSANRISGSIPPSWSALNWWGLSADPAEVPSLIFFSLAYNELNGLVPSFFVDVPSQSAMQLQGNHFTCAVGVLRNAAEATDRILFPTGCTRIELITLEPQMLASDGAFGSDRDSLTAFVELQLVASRLPSELHKSVACALVTAAGSLVFEGRASLSKAPGVATNASVIAETSVIADTSVVADAVSCSIPRAQLIVGTATLLVVAGRDRHVLLRRELEVFDRILPSEADGRTTLPRFGPAAGGTQISIAIAPCISEAARPSCSFESQHGSAGARREIVPASIRLSSTLPLTSHSAGIDGWCDATSHWLECTVPPRRESDSVDVFASLNSVDFVKICDTRTAADTCSFTYYDSTATVLDAQSEIVCMNDQPTSALKQQSAILVGITESLQSTGAVLLCRVSSANATLFLAAGMLSPVISHCFCPGGIAAARWHCCCPGGCPGGIAVAPMALLLPRWHLRVPDPLCAKLNCDKPAHVI